MSKFAVIGITQFETIVKVKKIPIEYSPRVSELNTIFTSLGGDAYNEALALKWLGNDATLCSVIGMDMDINMLNPAYRSVTLETNYIEKGVKETPTSVILFDNGRNEQIFEDIKDLRDAKYDMAMARPLISESDMVILSNANFCRPFIELAKEEKRPIAVNIHNFTKEKEIYNVDFLSAANILYFSDDTIKEDPFDFCKRISEKYGTEIVILGQGNKGLVIYDKLQSLDLHFDIVKTNEVVNAAGAGNALFASFLHFYVKTGDSIDSIKNAMLFASYKIGYMGTSNGFMTEEMVAQWRNLIWGKRD